VVRAVNIHASLLPRWRGAAPVAARDRGRRPRDRNHADAEEAGLDSGPILLSEAIPIDSADTTGTLTVRLAQLGQG